MRSLLYQSSTSSSSSASCSPDSNSSTTHTRWRRGTPAASGAAGPAVAVQRRICPRV
jgi:hypothetical protein